MKRNNLYTFLIIFFVGINSCFSQSCKPDESYTDKLTDEEVEFYGGKLETITSLFSKVEYRNKLYVSIDKEKNEPFLFLRLEARIAAGYAHLMEQSFNVGSKVGIRAGDDVFWFEVSRVQKSNFITGNTLYSNHFLTAPTDFNTLMKMKNLGIEAYQYSSANNEVFQGDILASKTSNISEQFECFLDKYYKK